MPVVLMVDGPSLGGFVCPATITISELWKMGQVRPGDSLRWKKLTLEEAYTQRLVTDAKMAALRDVATGVKSADQAVAELASFAPEVPPMPPTEAVLRVLEPTDSHPGLKLRLAGDRYVFLEYGPMELDLNLRVRIHELEQYLAEQKIEGLLETSPGVRSVMIEYDERKLPLHKLMEVSI